MKSIHITLCQCEYLDILTLIKGLPASVKHCSIELYCEPTELWMTAPEFQKELNRWTDDIMDVTFRFSYLGGGSFCSKDVTDGLTVTCQEIADRREEKGE